MTPNSNPSKKPPPGANNEKLGSRTYRGVRVRRTTKLAEFEKKDLSGRCRQLLEGYPRDILRRALGYLYTKETKSSFEIENVTLDASRTQRFIALLATAEKKDFFAKPELIDLHIPRFRRHASEQGSLRCGP